jgi:hypothetical protein
MNSLNIDKTTTSITPITNKVPTQRRANAGFSPYAALFRMRP